MNTMIDFKSIAVVFGLTLLSLLTASCCPPFCGRCTPLPASDSIEPSAAITIEYWDENGQPQIEQITASKTIHVSENQRFNIIYFGTDNFGIKYLWLHLSWVQWPAGLPQSVEPMVSPTDFGCLAYKTRSASQKFAWPGGPRAYKFEVMSEDYHRNRGRSVSLHVVYGQPPQPLDPD